MTTKKEILDCVKSIADHQDLIATRHNTDRKAEASATQTILAEIFRELRQIRKVLEYAAQEQAEMIPDDLNPIPPEDNGWITGPEAAKLIGWKTCNAKMLKVAGISFQQAYKCGKLSVCRSSIEKYLEHRENKRNKAK